METGGIRLGRSGGAAVAGLIGVPLAAIVWWLARPEAAAREVEPTVAVVPEIRGAAASREPIASRPVAVSTESHVHPTPPIASDNAGAPHAAGMLPHPITHEHARIFRENNLIGSLDTAMDAKDVPAMRALLTQYRDEYPEDANVMQEGYALVASCLENPGASTRAAAQRYYDERLDSGLRRYVRRFCLEAAE